MSSKEITEFYDTDRVKTAKVFIDTKTCCYFIDFYDNEKYVDTLHYPNKSYHYVESAAENYTLGILDVQQAT